MPGLTLDVASQPLQEKSERDRAVTDARREGINVGAIADALHVDRQIVYRIIRRK